MAYAVMKKLLSGGFRSASEFLDSLRVTRKDVAAMAEHADFERFMGLLNDDHFVAPQRLKASDPRFFLDDKYLRQMHKADWQGVDRRIQEFAARFVLAMRQRQIPVYVHCAARSVTDQLELVDAGRSKARPPWAVHVRGGAVDIVHSAYHWNLTDQEWAYLGKVGQAIAGAMGIQLEWGGKWKFYDPAHWQVADWKATTPENPGYNHKAPVRKTPSAIKAEGWQYVKGYTGNRTS